MKSSPTFFTGAVTVGTSAPAASAPSIPARTETGRQLLIQNKSASAFVYFGGDSTVTAATGGFIPPLGAVRIDTSAPVWLIADAAATDVRYSYEGR